MSPAKPMIVSLDEPKFDATITSAHYLHQSAKADPLSFPSPCSSGGSAGMANQTVYASTITVRQVQGQSPNVPADVIGGIDQQQHSAMANDYGEFMSPEQQRRECLC